MTFTLQMPLFLMESEGSHLNSLEGFFYHKEFISSDDEGFLIKYADSNPWDTTWKKLSLGFPVVMDFISEEKKKISHLLEPRSLFVLSGSARFNWKHGIALRKMNHFLGAVITRGRRLSCTFRNTSQSASLGEGNH